MVSVFSRRSIVRWLAVAGTMAVAAIVVAGISIGLLLLGGLIDAVGDSSGASTTPTTGVLPDVNVSGMRVLTLLMTVVGSKFFGVVGGDASLGAGSPLATLGLRDAGAQFSVFAPMVGLLVPVIAVAGWLAWRLSPACRTGLAARLVESALVGVVVGIALELIALVGTTSVTVSGVTLTVSAVGLPLFLGALVAGFLASLAGTSLAAAQATDGRTASSFARAVRDLPRALPIWMSAPAVVASVWAACFAVAAFVSVIAVAIAIGSATLGFAAPILLAPSRS